MIINENYIEPGEASKELLRYKAEEKRKETIRMRWIYFALLIVMIVFAIIAPLVLEMDATIEFLFILIIGELLRELFF